MPPSSPSPPSTRPPPLVRLLLGPVALLGSFLLGKHSGRHDIYAPSTAAATSTRRHRALAIPPSDPEPPHLAGAGIGATFIAADHGVETKAKEEGGSSDLRHRALEEAAAVLPPGVGACRRSYPDDDALAALEVKLAELSYELPPAAAKAIERHVAFLKASHASNEATRAIDPRDLALLHSIVARACARAIETWGSCTTAAAGLGYGTSSLAVLAGHASAMAHSGSGGRRAALVHYAIDAYQASQYNNAGVEGVARYFQEGGAQVNFYLVPEPSAVGWAAFAKTESCFDVVVLDGTQHGGRFAPTVAEVVLAGDVVATGGAVVVRNVKGWMPSVDAAEAWVASNLGNALRVVRHGAGEGSDTLVMVKRAGGNGGDVAAGQPQVARA